MHDQVELCLNYDHCMCTQIQNPKPNHVPLPEPSGYLDLAMHINLEETLENKYCMLYHNNNELYTNGIGGCYRSADW